MAPPKFRGYGLTGKVRKLFLFSARLFLETLPKIHFETSIKITSRGYFLFFEVVFYSLSTFSLLISEDFWILLSSLYDGCNLVPCPGFQYRGASECTLVPVFGAGEHPFGNHPFANPRLIFAVAKFRTWPNLDHKKVHGFPLRTPICHTVPPGTKPIHAGNNYWGIHFCANTCGACIRTRANTGKYF